MFQAYATRGRVYHVDGTNGAVGASGSVLAPLKTIQAAVNKCVTGRGDVVVVRPGTYEENVIVTKDYVSLVGSLPGGYGRPDLAPETGVSLVVRAQGFTTERIRFYSGDSDVVRVEGNGFRFSDCVLDGDDGMAATEALMRLWTHVSDDHFTGSEGLIEDCYFRGTAGLGLVFDCQHATVGVLPTDNVIRRCRFADITGEDVLIAATAVAVNGIDRTLFDACMFGLGASKNKATHIDLKTNDVGNTGVVFAGCFFNDDTLDNTAVKVDGCGVSLIGCASLDGIVDGSALD